MQNVGVETTQNVLINYELASIGDRILATLFDWLIFIGYFGLVTLALIPINFNIPTFAFIILYLPIFFYHLISEIFFNGQSLGKKQMKIKVMKLDGSRPSIGAYLFRWMIRPLDMFMYGAVAMITILVTGKGQRLGDLTAGTTVIKIIQRLDLTHQEVFKQSQETHIITFPQVNKLSDQDVSLIKETLQVYRNSANAVPLAAMENKVKSHLNIQSDLPAVKFLYTIIKDYTHYNTQYSY